MPQVQFENAMKKQTMHFGIDYGAKLAGTTVICCNQDGKIHLYSSEKKEDSDKFISQKITELNPSAVYIDAPLSLPSAYFGKGDNFHFRKCDLECQAMSPMFLGGLTARAMKLSNNHPKLDFYETYPSYFIREVIKAKEIYKKKEMKVNQEMIELIQTETNLSFADPIENYHQLDAIICWLCGQRHVDDMNLALGDAKEGLIIV